MKIRNPARSVTLYDAAPPLPLLFLTLGVPVLVVLAVIVLTLLAVRLIRRARRRQAEEAQGSPNAGNCTEEPSGRDPS